MPLSINQAEDSYCYSNQGNVKCTSYYTEQGQGKPPPLPPAHVPNQLQQFLSSANQQAQFRVTNPKLADCLLWCTKFNCSQQAGPPETQSSRKIKNPEPIPKFRTGQQQRVV
jgi:hypothetical protein